MPIMRIEIRDPERRQVPNGERGEIWFNGPMLIRGYWNKPEATAETIVDGWLRSGDIGRVDDEGFFYIEDRLKDMILRGGENVYCAEVESRDLRASGNPRSRRVRDSRRATRRGGRRRDPPRRRCDADARRSSAPFLSKKIAAFMIPSRVVIMPEPLPRNPAGKFLKRELRNHVSYVPAGS